MTAFLTLLWLFLCQTAFYFIQQNQSLAVQKSLQGQFREELRASNFLYLSRAVSDLDENGAIRCARLTRREGLVILDLRYKPDCARESSNYLLAGTSVRQELRAINGDFYDLEYLTVNSPIFYLALWVLRLSGLAIFLLLALFFESRRKQTQILLEAERKVAQAKVDIARQVAHDIRSPISAMRMVLPLLTDSTEKVEILKAAANRVDEIAGDLLARQKSVNSAADSSDGTATDVIKLAREILTEKSMIHGNGKIRLVGDFDHSVETRIFVSEKELKRMLSNLINNSVEAIDGSGEVRLTVRDFEDWVQIGVTDTGRGMSQEILARVGERGFSHGKSGGESGSGLGLFHAREFVQDNGGKLDVSSRLDIGTAIMISFPKGSKPA